MKLVAMVSLMLACHVCLPWGGIFSDRELPVGPDEMAVVTIRKVRSRYVAAGLVCSIIDEYPSGFRSMLAFVREFGAHNAGAERFRSICGVV